MPVHEPPFYDREAQRHTQPPERKIDVFYVQDCEICLRPLEIRVEFLGEELFCPLCDHAFIAADPPPRVIAATYPPSGYR